MGVGHRAEDSRLSSAPCPAGRRPGSIHREEPRRPVLAFIDQIVIPFLTALYGAVGYVGVMVAMAIESAMIPLPSELILPVRRVPGLRSRPARAAHGAALELLDRGRSWRRSGTRSGSLIAYAIGAYGGRPFLERYGRYLLIRPHEIEIADRLLRASTAPRPCSSAACCRSSGRSSRSRRASPACRSASSSSTRRPGALPWSIALVWAGRAAGRELGDIRDMLSRSTSRSRSRSCSASRCFSGGGWGCRGARSGRRRPADPRRRFRARRTRSPSPRASRSARAGGRGRSGAAASRPRVASPTSQRRTVRFA